LLPLLLGFGLLLVLVLVDCFSRKDPLKDLLVADPFRVTVLNLFVESHVTLKVLVKAAEDPTAEHHNALFQGGCDQLLFVLRLAAAPSLHK
jgi:hypothetical protein